MLKRSTPLSDNKGLYLLCAILFACLPAFSQETLGEKLISDFYQTQVAYDGSYAACIDDHEWGNCVSIAVIKASLAEFKTVKAIYKGFSIKNDTVFIVFNDDLKIFVSNEERNMAAGMAGFGKGINSMYYDTAIIIYASICKRALERKYIYPADSACLHTFKDAVYFINSGYSTGSAGELLCLKLSPVGKKEALHSNAAIIRTSAHTAFCTKGVQDFLGRRHPVKMLWMRNPIGPGAPINAAYILSKP